MAQEPAQEPKHLMRIRCLSMEVLYDHPFSGWTNLRQLPALICTVQSPGPMPGDGPPPMQGAWARPEVRVGAATRSQFDAALEAQGGLDAVVDPPLEAGERPEHENAGAQAPGGKVDVAEVGGDGGEAAAAVRGAAEKGD